MIRTLRSALLGVLSLSLALGGMPAYAQVAPKPAVQAEAGWGPGPVVFPKPRNVWPQAWSDIAPDPAVRFGTLPNGMRYAIMKNATPSGQASLRLRFDIGSIMERDDQQGLAHFLEHMAFNGSKAVPEGDMVKILERLGLAFGADTNASTGFTETTYKLDLPRTDDETVDTALHLFRETASELLIAQEAVERERGIVLSEERTRDSPAYRMQKAEIAFLLGDALPARRMPIGTPEILRAANRGAIHDLYRDYYRPERATLIFVGDFDPDKMEAKIKARFSGWTATGKAGAEPALTLPLKRKPDAKVVVEPGAALSIGLSWISPPDLDPDSKVERTEEMTRDLGFAVLNRRLERLSRAGEPPFIAAAAYNYGFFHSADITGIEITSPPGRWREGLTAAIVEQRRAVQFGVTKDEVDRELDGIRAGLKSAVAAAATRRTPALANELVGGLENGIVQTSPAQDLALFEAAVPTFTAERVSAALKEAFAGSGPLVFVGTPTPIEGGEAAVDQALLAAIAQPVTAGAALATKTWPYETFGKTGVVAEEQLIDDLGVTFIRFANGVRLTVKPTKFRNDQVILSARIGAGRLDMPKDKVTAAWTLPISFIEAGLADLTAEEVEVIMRSRIVDATLSIDDDAFIISGGTRPEDLDPQLQLMTAYAVKPGWRPEPFQRMKTFGATVHDQQDATPRGVMSREMGALLYGGDARWTFPTREQIAAGKPADVRALLEGPLSTGPIEVLIVGDITVEQAKAAVAKTFGALPARPDTQKKAAGQISFPAPNTTPVVLTHKGRADQAIGVMAWKTNDFFADTKKSRALRVLGDVLDLRMIEEIREKQGATYSPQSSVSASSVFTGYGSVMAMIETTPENLPRFFSDIERMIGDLRDKPATPDELDRAKKPALDALDKRFETNEFWLGQLSGAQTDPRKLPALRTAKTGLKEITPADIQAVAREYLQAGKAWKLVVLKEGLAVPALTPAAQ